MKQENHETRTFSRVFNICKPSLSLSVRFFVKVVFFQLYWPKNREVKRRGQSIQGEMKGMKSLQRRVTGDRENNYCLLYM